MLVRYIRALCPQQAIDEYTPDAWHDLLGHLDLDVARHAAGRVAWRQPFVAPSEIIAEAERKEVRRPYERTVTEAFADSAKRELPAAEAIPPPPHFTAALRDLNARLRLKAEQALAVDRETARRASAWISYKLSGKLPPQLPPLGSPPPPRWVQLPGDPPELREWLARQAQTADTS